MENSYHENKNAMYQFPAQHHYPHHLYSQCPTKVDHANLQNMNTAGPEAKFTSFLPQNVILEDHLQLSEPVKSSEAELTEVKGEKKKRNPRKPKTDKAKTDEPKKKSDRSVDTSVFTIEERLVAAVWIHERHHTHHTITEIKAKFLDRFNREPPSKTALFAWERKLFATGNVCDAPRPGRPEKRKSHMSEVVDSLKTAPALSLRARAQALRLPRTTLHNIMKNDLPHEHTLDKGKASDKPPPKRRVKQPPRKTAGDAPPPAPAPPPPPPPAPAPAPHLPAHSHMHYVMHAMHSHSHAYS